jgi:hypothetical protein
MTRSSKKEPIHCPFHEGKWSDKEPCVGPGASCAVLAESALLQDRLDMIVALAEDARNSYLHNSDVMPGVSLSVALETIRLLARSMTEEDQLKDGDAFIAPGDDRVMLMALRQKPRPLPTGDGGEELHLTPKTRPARQSEPAREPKDGSPGSATVPAPTIAN